MKGIKVDGNDILAVKFATDQARKFILENNQPFFIESLTY
jgi:TPP-dependent pyruvate/acetoin dehydrogenase alpha subunit